MTGAKPQLAVYQDKKGNYFAVASDSKGNMVKVEGIVTAKGNGVEAMTLSQDTLRGLAARDPATIGSVAKRFNMPGLQITGGNFNKELGNRLAADHLSGFANEATGYRDSLNSATAALNAARRGEYGAAMAGMGEAAANLACRRGTKRLCDALGDMAKKVPNPFGKKGGPAHQAKVENVVQEVEARGLQAVQELRVPTPDGKKATRYVDVAGVDPATGEVRELHQVGRQTQGGMPVSRERSACDDIECATGIRPEFHPYN
jgi:hypothetical protein